MSLEAGVVVGKDGSALYWHLPKGRSGGSLPDSRELWEFIWKNRDSIDGIAHSHPGKGVPGPSYEDVTTFSAIEDALGRRLNWWITSDDELILARWAGKEKLTYRTSRVHEPVVWLNPLRVASQRISLEQFKEVVREEMRLNLDATEALKLGNRALNFLVEAVLHRIPHADPSEIRELIQDAAGETGKSEDGGT